MSEDSESMMEEYARIKYTQIPQYLCDLFDCILQKIRKRAQIFLIKSEYATLETELQNVLNEFIVDQYRHKIEYTQEYEWKIESEDFKDFMQLSVQSINGTQFEGPQFEFRKSDTNTHKSMTFIPIITRVYPSLVENCAIGIEIQSVNNKNHNSFDSRPLSFCWSFGVKELQYSHGCESEVSDAQNIEDDYDGNIAFENERLNDLDCFIYNFCRCFTVFHKF